MSFASFRSFSLTSDTFPFQCSCKIDCNWGDHCAAVSNEFAVVSYRTPNGLQYREFEAAMKKFRDHTIKRRQQQ